MPFAEVLFIHVSFGCDFILASRRKRKHKLIFQSCFTCVKYLKVTLQLVQGTSMAAGASLYLLYRRTAPEVPCVRNFSSEVYFVTFN